MKRILFLFAFLPTWLCAQNLTSFNFEEAVPPTDWKALNGTLSVTTEHYKEGKQSLCWESAGTSVLEIGVRQFATASMATYMMLRSPEATDDRLVIEFLDHNGAVKRTANVEINFKGWQELNRAYSEYAQAPVFSLRKVRLTLNPTNATATRKLYFDKVNFAAQETDKLFGSMWRLDADQLKQNNYQLSLLANTIDIPLTVPTEQEKNEVDTLRARLPRTAAKPANLFLARRMVTSFAIKRNADGSVTGNPIDFSYNVVNSAIISSYLNNLEALAYSPKDTDKPIFNDLLDHLMDQGFSQGLNFVINTSNYTDAAYICGALLNVAYKMTDDVPRKIEVLKLVRWLSEYGTVYYPENNYLSKFNSDLIYNFLPHFYGYALLQPDYAVAVRELKAMKRYLERHTQVVPGTCDMIKIDGVGFHHWTHYNNYMYAYRTWVDYVYYLRGTSFNMGAAAYPRLREAVLATYKMGNKKEGSNNGSDHFTANALAGRNPYIKGGVNIQVPLFNLERLIEAGGTILGTPIDTELAAAYNYFSNSTKYDVPARSYDGCYQFNYSPVGISRKGDWVATMRAPTSLFWGAEIYNKQNRLGRYQSHGSLEIIYTGGYERSGFPTQNGNGGWDWNVVPGTTTVHYTDWQEMMPGKSTSQRFDQKTKGTDFSGALADGNCGVFATDFVQGDDWGSQVFTPTNLKFKKSVFTFDDFLVALGSDISASGSFGTDMLTATNLFQEVKSPLFGDFVVDGATVVEGGAAHSLSGDKNHYLVTPLGTGYILPKGNNNITVKYGEQTSPLETGADCAAPNSTVTAVKAYIEHGKQPTHAAYNFVVVPATTPAKLAAMATEVGDGGGALYTVESKTNKLHAVTAKKINTTGYAFFEPVSNIAFGEVVATTSEHLLMVKRDIENNRLSFAACNPNLRPVSDAVYGNVATPTTTKLTVRGVWKTLSATDGVGEVVNNAGNTVITLTLKEGLPEYFTLGALSDDIDQKLSEDWVRLSNTNTQLMLYFAEETSENKVSLYSANGVLLQSSTVCGDRLEISKNSLSKGFYLLRVKNNRQNKTFKVIIE